MLSPSSTEPVSWAFFPARFDLFGGSPDVKSRGGQTAKRELCIADRVARSLLPHADISVARVAGMSVDLKLNVGERYR